MTAILQADFTGAIRKTQTLYSIPKAARTLLSVWCAGTVKELKRSAADLQKSGKGRKTGQLARSVSFDIDLGGEAYTARVGTNLAGLSPSSKYARIQDEGGVTHPTVTPKMRRWAWFMFRKEFAGAVRGLRLSGAARRGAFETFGNMDNKYKAIALTRKAKLTVTVPASHWFTRVIEDRRPVLTEMMGDAAVLKKAEEMGGAGGGNA